MAGLISIGRMLLGMGSSDKTVDHIAAGAKTIATMIDERKFTTEEASKASLEFLRLNMDQNSERSRSRRELAMNWVNFYLKRIIPGYLIFAVVSVYRPELAPVKGDFMAILKIMSTGTLMVLGFFFGLHLATKGIGMLKK